MVARRLVMRDTAEPETNVPIVRGITPLAAATATNVLTVAALTKKRGSSRYRREKPPGESSQRLLALRDFELDPAVLEASLLRVVVGHRLAFAEALGDQAAAVDALADEVVPHRLGARIG